MIWLVAMPSHHLPCTTVWFSWSSPTGRGRGQLLHPPLLGRRAFPVIQETTVVLLRGSWRPCVQCSGRNGTSWVAGAVCILWRGDPALRSYNTCEAMSQLPIRSCTFQQRILPHGCKYLYITVNVIILVYHDAYFHIKRGSSKMTVKINKWDK